MNKNFTEKEARRFLTKKFCTTGLRSVPVDWFRLLFCQHYVIGENNLQMPKVNFTTVAHNSFLTRYQMIKKNRSERSDDSVNRLADYSITIGCKEGQAHKIWPNAVKPLNILISDH